VKNAHELDVQIASNRSVAVKRAPPPEFLEQLDLRTIPPATLRAKLEAIFAHPRFGDLIGAGRWSPNDPDVRRRFFAGVVDSSVELVKDMQRQGPKPDLAPWGPRDPAVAGPSYDAGLRSVLDIEFDPAARNVSAARTTPA
jgi:hypothetical protein